MKSIVSIVAAALAGFVPVMAQTPSGFSPSTNETFSVQFGNTTVTSGGFIPIQDTQLSPAIDLSGLATESGHVVLMLDLDAPMGDANRTFSPLLHWMAPLPSDTQTLPGNDSSIEPAAAYFGPAPPPGYGAHRYVLLLLTDPSDEFELPPGFEGETYMDVTSRVVFDIDGFVEAGGFTLAAANWFTTENRTTVPEPSGANCHQPIFGLAGGALLFVLSAFLI